ncbi:hypothetical protein CKO44_08215 [Rubrivivax gelatinosus]|uniref:DnaJ family domain-containing protein n=1 Tax=Rubrivivax gelatinosus TaxID=28068 RepID=UPI001907553C|nr:hypothetical protein [Rubrivivax gelatinosus]
MTSKRESERLARLRTLDEQIADALRESLANGELKSAPSWGRPLASGDGYDETPDALKMPFKVLKNAGHVPAEVELMRTIAALQAEVDAAPAAEADTPPWRAKRQRLGELRQQLALRLEHLRRSGSL